MAADVSEFRVFIASPSDLEEERAELRRLERALNVNFAIAGIRVRFVGWEEVPPGYGRPQAQINPLVDECDIFIGMLRRKWGTATGEHESGFEEEFERAVTRRKNTGSQPEIALYFASLSEGELDDAGPDLRKVLRFKKRIEREHIALYATFASPEDIAHQVSDLLNKHLIKLVVAQRAQSTPEGTTSGASFDDAVDSSKQVEKVIEGAEELDAASIQIVAMLDSVRDLIRRRKAEVPVDRDRLELLGTALGRDEETLGTHLVNRLYRRGRELELIHGEFTCWLRTLLEDIGQRSEAVHRVVPGWMLINPKDDDTIELLLEYAKKGGYIGHGALRTLQRLKMRPTQLWPPALRSSDAGGKTQAVATPDAECRAAWVDILEHTPGPGVAIDYLLQDIDSTDMDVSSSTHVFLAELSRDAELNESTRKLVDSARQALEGEPEALADSLRFSSDDKAAWRLVIRNIEKLSPKLLNQIAGQSSNRQAKLAAIKAGLAAQTLSDSTLTDLLMLDDDQEVADLLVESVASDIERARQFLMLLRKTEKAVLVPENEARLLAVVEPPEVLRQRRVATEYSIRPWEALSYSQPAELLNEAREVLRTDAAALRADVEPRLSEEHKRLVDYLADDQLRAAANLLSRCQPRSHEDIDLLLAWFAKEAADGLLQDHVWKVLARIADSTTIAKITETIRPHIAVVGFIQAIEYFDSPLAPAVATVLIEGSTKDFVRAEAYRWSIQQPERTEGELREALYSEDDVVRITAAQLLAQRLNRAELIRLHDEYPKVGRSFWYNVVALFDEYLYAPTPTN